MKIDVSQLTSPATIKRPLLERIRASAGRLVSRMLPWIDVQVDCPSCWARLQIIDEPVVREDLCLLPGARWWLCPRCEYTTCFRHMYFGPMDGW